MGPCARRPPTPLGALRSLQPGDTSLPFPQEPPTTPVQLRSGPICLGDLGTGLPPSSWALGWGKPQLCPEFPLFLAILSLHLSLLWIC